MQNNILTYIIIDILEQSTSPRRRPPQYSFHHPSSAPFCFIRLTTKHPEESHAQGSLKNQ